MKLLNIFKTLILFLGIFGWQHSRASQYNCTNTQNNVISIGYSIGSLGLPNFNFSYNGFSQPLVIGSLYNSSPDNFYVIVNGNIFTLRENVSQGPVVLFTPAGQFNCTLLPSLYWNQETLLQNPGPSLMGGNWGKAITTDSSGYLDVVWLQKMPGTGSFVMFAQSIDDGTTWTKYPLAPSPGSDYLSLLPKITSSGQNVYVAYTNLVGTGNMGVYLIHGVRAGNQVQWSQPKQISQAPVGENSAGVSLAVSGNAVHLVWTQSPNNAAVTVYYSGSIDSGKTWSQPILMAPKDKFNHWTPSVAATGNNVYIAWTDARFGGPNCLTEAKECHEVLYMRKSANYGQTWNPELQITCNVNNDYTWAPSLVAENNAVHITYFKGNPFPPGRMDIYYQRSLNYADDLKTCAPVAKIPFRYPSGDTVLSAFRPNIAVSNGVVHMVWWGELSANQMTGPSKVYYSRSNDGLNWDPATSLTPQINGTSYRSAYPNIALSNNGLKAFTVWQDNRSTPGTTDYQVYFRSSK